jgi:ribosome-associated toxin RatA of RatAB toxin-antitoxin module
MAKVEKSVLVHFSAQKMYELVHNVAAYPEFLPWCGGSSVIPQEDGMERASVEIAFKGIKQSFTTLNTLEPGKAIYMSLIDGPFKSLKGQWSFVPLADHACKVTFQLNYEFSSKVLEQLVGPVFHSIANSFVDSFIKRAENLQARGEM